MVDRPRKKPARRPSPGSAEPRDATTPAPAGTPPDAADRTPEPRRRARRAETPPAGRRAARSGSKAAGEDDLDVAGEDLVLVGSDEASRAIDLDRSPGPIAPYDPLGVYLREINRYSLLTPEQEKELAVRFFEQQDVDAAAQLVTANLRLVVKISFEYRRAYRNVMDLIQEGNIGLMQAVKKFDPYRGVKLSTYASWWIRAYILRYLLNNWRLVKIGTTQAQRRLFFNLSKERRRLESLGIDPTPQQIADGLSVTAKEVVEMDRRLSSPEFSLDAPARGSGGSSDDGQASARIDLLSNDDVPADELLGLARFNDKLHEKVAAFAESLSGREADVFRNRLWADKPETLQEIGDRYGLTREGIRQVEKRILNQLRGYLESEMGEYLDFD
jgi:RNA polymerase sigma-32 factor